MRIQDLYRRRSLTEIPMRLRAEIRRVAGNTSHWLAAAKVGGIDLEKVPPPHCIEIVEQEGAFYLLHLDRLGACIADTWHPTLEEAKAQADFEFGIKANEWQEL